MFFDPIVYFFILGIISSICGASLRLSKPVYETISLYLLMAIGLKGGYELAHWMSSTVIMQSAVVITLGLACIAVALFVLKLLTNYPRRDIIVIAAHYGSVSVGTYAVAISILSSAGIAYEPYMPLFVALLEFPAIIVAALLLEYGAKEKHSILEPLTDALKSKSIFALIASIIIGLLMGEHGAKSIAPLFFDLFKGVLALFLLQMGTTVGQKLPEIKKHWKQIIVTSIILCLVGAALGLVVAKLIGLSQGGCILLMTLAASASYIAVPASLEASYPNDNIPLALTYSLGATLPFNILVGINLYVWISSFFY